MEPGTIVLWFEAITAGLVNLGKMVEILQKAVAGTEITPEELDLMKKRRAQLLSELHDAAKFDRLDEGA